MRTVLTLCFLISFIACQPEGRVYIKHKKLSPDVEWLKKDVREFEIPIENKEQIYELSLTFRYATGYQFKTLKVNVVETSPSGKTTLYDYSLKVRDENGEYIGDPGYDIWDSEHLVEPDKKYTETGVYTYVIQHDMPVDPLYFAMEIGMILDKKNP